MLSERQTDLSRPPAPKGQRCGNCATFWEMLGKCGQAPIWVDGRNRWREVSADGWCKYWFNITPEWARVREREGRVMP